MGIIEPISAKVKLPIALPIALPVELPIELSIGANMFDDSHAFETTLWMPC